MKTTYQATIYTLLIILTFGTSSCIDMYKSCKNMPEQIVGTGEIIDNTLFKMPLDISSSPQEGQVITSDSLNIFNLEVSFDNGGTYMAIDFSEYTVLGKYASGGCHVVFDRNVTKNIEKKQYIYTITVIECGDCYSMWSSMNWVLIPKIEDNFSVEFLVKYKSN